MTCIVGIVRKIKGKKTVFMGSDRGIFIGDDDFHISPHPKIFKRSIGKSGDKIVIGVAGDHRQADVIEQIKFTELDINNLDKKSVARFLKQKFIPFLKENMKEKGEMHMMIGIFGNIFWIDGSYAVVHVPSHGYAVGSAASPAKAALFTMSKLAKTLPPKKVLKMALQAAESSSTACRGPFDFLKL